MRATGRSFVHVLASVLDELVSQHYILSFVHQVRIIGTRRSLSIDIVPLLCSLYRAMSTTTGLLAQWSRDSIDNDMQRIYSAGIEAVRPASLVERVLQYDQDSGTLHCAGRSYALNRLLSRVALT